MLEQTYPWEVAKRKANLTNEEVKVKALVDAASRNTSPPQNRRPNNPEAILHDQVNPQVVQQAVLMCIGCLIITAIVATVRKREREREREITKRSKLVPSLSPFSARTYCRCSCFLSLLFCGCLGG